LDKIAQVPEDPDEDKPDDDDEKPDEEESEDEESNDEDGDGDEDDEHSDHDESEEEHDDFHVLPAPKDGTLERSIEKATRVALVMVRTYLDDFSNNMAHYLKM
jgi:ABC-type Zn2+ transport system substrate-binding protein/surface adhesin